MIEKRSSHSWVAKVTEEFAAALGDDPLELVLNLSFPRCGEDKDDQVSLWEFDPVCVDRMAVFQFGRKLVLEAAHRRVDKGHRPQWQLLLNGRPQCRRQLSDGGETSADHPLFLQRADTERDLGDDARDPLGVGDEVQFVTGELAHLSGGHHDPGRDDVLRERAVLKTPIAKTALGQPAGDRGRGRAGRIQA